MDASTGNSSSHSMAGCHAFGTATFCRCARAPQGSWTVMMATHLKGTKQTNPQNCYQKDMHLRWISWVTWTWIWKDSDGFRFHLQLPRLRVGEGCAWKSKLNVNCFHRFLLGKGECKYSNLSTFIRNQELGKSGMTCQWVMLIVYLLRNG